ncbi:hypothetical protein GPECTOR_31g335 [Gonium pectorale]|uniref:Cilia- and flagella-associated protein 206 n=1 Tax=Gonium pectorale TaxID=33097 RepID=A0A150GDW5_GONPE|nr:hypothetical protein GPECTOR_31g335 [Gonium pectorale]|eukprot:KXZ47973.1 hypothetical protein GPECTOR_31g335 [Gonium pectorale]
METNLKRIVSEATRICRERGLQVNPYVVAYVASLEEARGSLQALVPDLQLDTPLSAEAVAVVGKHVALILQRKDDARLRTATMQVLMESAYKQQRDVIEKETAEQQERAGMLQRAVTGPRALKGNSSEAYDKFYGLVLEAVCVEAGMELAVTDPDANAEVRAALESVFPVSAVARFLTLTEAERGAQLAELGRIVTGICLYNRSLGQGGSALPAAAASYLPQAQRLLRELHGCCSEVTEQLAKLHALVAKLPPAAPDAEMAAADVAAVAAAASEAEVRRASLHAEVVHRGQALQLFESLAADLQASAAGGGLREGLDAARQLDTELEQTIVQVHDAVGSSAAVSKDVVYPLLGALHSGLHQELRMLVVRQRLYDELRELSALPPGSVLSPPTSASGAKRTTGAGAAGSRAGSAGTATAAAEALAEQLSEVTLAGLDALEKGGGSGGGLEYIRPTSTSTLQPGLALAGFCAGTLARRPTGPYPLLRRANPRLGYLAYQDKVYGFATNADMQAFLNGPEDVLEVVAAAVRVEPLLARPLGLPPPAPTADVHAVLSAMVGPLKVDFGCQTPVHFLESHIDKSYEWNVWALRRRALALANLRGKATHGTQTAESHFKRENETQVWRPREATVQTRSSKGQSMPRKLQYVAGLRGAPDVKMNVVRLELDLGQPHQH